MKYAIALKQCFGCAFWDGECFQNGEKEAAKFDTSDLAEKAMYAIFFKEPPTDDDDAAFDARLYVQAVVG